MRATKIGIVSRCDKEDALEMVASIIDHFKEVVSIAVSPKTAEVLGIEGIDSVPVENMRQEGVDLIISIGGDGTVLRNISKMGEPLPVLGVNMGTLGFLVDVNPEDALDAIEDVLEDFSYTERARMAVSLNGQNLPPATNEVVLITGKPAKILTFKITVDGHNVEELRADGVIFATPTGSTAYAMSAGGPIIDPRVDGVVIVPIAPFKLSSRPWVIPGSATIKVEMILPDKEAAVVIDGQHTYNIGENDVVALTKAKHPARFVRASVSGFYEKFRSKLA